MALNVQSLFVSEMIFPFLVEYVNTDYRLLIAFWDKIFRLVCCVLYCVKCAETDWI